MRRNVAAWGGAAIVAIALLAAVHQQGAGKGLAQAPVAAVAPAPAGAGAADPTVPPGAGSARAARFHDRVPTNVELADQRALARWQRQFEAAVNERIAMLLERGDARSLYEAYLLLPGSGALGDDDYWRDHQALLDRARALAPDDAHLALLAAMGCGACDCDRASAIDDLLRLQSENALGALFALDAAIQAGDRAAIDRWLARAAEAEFYDMGYTRTVGDHARAFASVPSPPLDPDVVRRSMAWSGLGSHDAATADDARDLHALIVAGTHPLPSTVGLSGLCSARRVAPANRANCNRIWRHMAASDAALAQMMSLGQLVQMTGDATARRHWQARLRHFSWVMQESNRFMDMQALRDQVRLGEIQARERLLQRRGITMPAGWLPDHPRHRSLILTGRLPPGDPRRPVMTALIAPV